MSKKIVIDARLYGLEHTGIGRYLIHLIEELQKLDKENKYYVLLSDKYFNKLKFPKSWNKVKVNYKHYTFAEQFGLVKTLQSIKPDLVHFPSFNVPILWCGKFVTTIHDMTMHFQKKSASKLPLPIYLFKRIPYKFVFWYAVNRSKKIIVPTISVKKQITKYFNLNLDKTKVIYEGFDENLYSESGRTSIEKYNLPKDYFFYVGDVYPHKNIKEVIDAISYLKKERNKNCYLVIASARGYFVDELENYAKELDASENIKFLGFVPNSDLSSLYKYSRALVYPSLSEGFGLQGLEAMASGTLVLASDIPVFREIYNENAFYFDPSDKVSIAEKMILATKLNQNVRKKKIMDSQKFIQKYSWHQMAKETLKIYNSIV